MRFLIPRSLRGRRGAVLIFVAVGSFVLLGLAGLALDGGMAYLTRAKLSRAVDAGSLAGARSLRQGAANAQAEAYAVAAANGVVPDGSTTTLTFEIINDPVKKQRTVGMRATRTIPLLFSRVLGNNEMEIAAAAEATVPPIDLVLVVDRSGSMEREGAWGDLKVAVRNFVALFDITPVYGDQLGLVSFQIRANDDVLIADGDFKTRVNNAMTPMGSAGDTNTGEGLRFAQVQFQRPNIRPAAAKVVVFFTDGRPTAFRGSPIGGGPNLGQDRVMAVGVTVTGNMRGYWNNPQSLSMNQQHDNPTGCGGSSSCSLNGTTWRAENPTSIRNTARSVGLDAARAIRAEGKYVYTIGLGNSDHSNPILQPDLGYLRQMSNEDHNDNPTHLAGRSYYAPSAAELNQVFQLLAKDLLVRLSR